MPMLQQIIDRRLSGKNKSIGNRERFLRRYKDQVREAVKKAISGRSIRDIEQGESISIPKRDISEPVFRHGQGGTRETVHPGNQEYVAGDRVKRPKGGQGGGGGGDASNEGEGQDDFVFQLSKEEFMQVFFEDLELPHLVRTQLTETPDFEMRRAGYVSDGVPTNLHMVRSMRGALARRITLGTPVRREIKEAEAELAGLQARHPVPEAEIALLQSQIEALRRRALRIPYLDPIDLRYRHRVKTPIPSSKAVMFCLMDVSGSMDEQRKDLSKRFFILLYLFLTRHYERIEIVFIRHHTQAMEVSEDEFFHATESGGTVVSSALELMHKIQAERYDPDSWNVYVAQASDGDNWPNDCRICRDWLVDKILPVVRYFAYVQVAQPEQNLWEEYAALAPEHPNFAMRKVATQSEIYPIFRELFRKEVNA